MDISRRGYPIHATSAPFPILRTMIVLATLVDAVVALSLANMRLHKDAFWPWKSTAQTWDAQADETEQQSSSIPAWQQYLFGDAAAEKASDEDFEGTSGRGQDTEFDDVSGDATEETSDEDFEGTSGRGQDTEFDDVSNDLGLNQSQEFIPVLSDATGLDYVNWSLCGMAFHSNLGGLGPDGGEQALRYSNIAHAGGDVAVDLVVTVDGDYDAKDVTRNGLTSSDSCFGIINLKTHFSGYREVALQFNLYLAGTNTSVAFDRFYFSVYDFDTGNEAVEHATFYRRVNQVYYVQDHEMNISGHVDTIGLTFSSTQQGDGTDNPKDSFSLTPAEQKRAVMVEYINESMWNMKFAVSGGKGGRNFVFASKTNLPLAMPATATTTTTSCPPNGPRSCRIWADPHVAGFDNFDNQGPQYLAMFKGRSLGTDMFGSAYHTFDQRPMDVDAFEVGDFWLVKNDLVHVQARFRRSGEFIPDKAAVGAVAVGGPFLKNRTIVVEPLDGHVNIDGLVLASGSWSDDDEHIEVRQPTDEDVELDLPMGVQLTFKRFPKHIDVKITMPQLPGGVDGECGNFDGVAENDGDEDVQERMGSVQVEDSMLLFASKFIPDADMVSQGGSFSENDYQEMAALQNDEAMANFVRRLLESENKIVLPEDIGELEGFVPWFSGTKATQSLKQMKEELLSKEWVRDAPAAHAVNEADDNVVVTEHSQDSLVPAEQDMVKAPAALDGDATCSDCLLWGASHILSFSAFRKHIAQHPQREAAFRVSDWRKTNQSVSATGTYWLVKTQSMKIQGRFWPIMSSPGAVHLGAVAIGGTFLGGNRLIIRNGWVQWNEQEILEEVPSKFSNSFFTAEYSDYAETVLSGMLGKGIEFKFHNGMVLTVQYHHKVLDARIRMCESQVEDGTLEGQCGIFEATRSANERALDFSRQANLKLQRDEIIFPDGTAARTL